MMDNMMGEKGMGKGMKCGCPHHKVVPLMVVLFGLTFLLRAMGTITPETAGMIWPIVVIIAGGTKLFSNSCKCC
jgi:hypothetical protein